LFQFEDLFKFKFFSVSKKFEILKNSRNGKSENETVNKETAKKKKQKKRGKRANAQWAKPTTSQDVRRPVLSDQVGVQARPGRLVSALSVGSQIDACRHFLVGRPNMNELFSFSSVIFFYKF
jgi:hypothetical protein